MRNKVNGIGTSVLAGMLNCGCVPFDFSGNCSREVDSSWVSERENPQEMILVNMNYDFGFITLDHAGIYKKYFHGEEVKPHEDYTAVVVNNVNERIYMKKFGFGLFVVSEGFPHESFMGNTEWSIYVPYRDDARRVDIYDPNCIRVLSVDVNNLKRKDE